MVRRRYSKMRRSGYRWAVAKRKRNETEDGGSTLRVPARQSPHHHVLGPRSSFLSCPPMLDSRRIVRWAYIGRLSLSAAIFSAALFAWEIANPTNTRLAALMLVGSMIFTVGSA